MRSGMTRARVAGGVFTAIMLAGCAGNPFGGQTANVAPPTDNMAGRWMLAAPNAPVCGMNFSGVPGAQEGKVAPEGGCPEKFYLSRRWTLEQSALTIIDDENNPLATLTLAGGRFEGPSNAGTPVTLARQPTLAAPAN
jgi:hypothetical protein